MALSRLVSKKEAGVGVMVRVFFVFGTYLDLYEGRSRSFFNADVRAGGFASLSQEHDSGVPSFSQVFPILKLTVAKGEAFVSM